VILKHQPSSLKRWPFFAKALFNAFCQRLTGNSLMDQGTTSAEFEGLFRQHFRPLCGFALGYVKDADQAEDIVQELFARLWQDREALSIQVSVKSYLFTAVRNRCLNALVVKKRMRPLDEEVHDAAEGDWAATRTS
jgi:DNA-directed RNA polymerase specialized sigma24 family protein